MNINLVLKERREKSKLKLIFINLIFLVNKILQHKRTKVIRKFKQDKREFESVNSNNNPSESIKSKIEKYQNVEKMINNFDTKIGADSENKKPENPKPNNRINNQDKNQNNFKNEKSNRITNNESKNEGKSFMNKKRDRKTTEEIEKEKKEKIDKRQKTFRNLNKKNKKGQPVMKFRVEHLFNKLKNKIDKGLI